VPFLRREGKTRREKGGREGVSEDRGMFSKNFGGEVFGIKKVSVKGGTVLEVKKDFDNAKANVSGKESSQKSKDVKFPEKQKI